MDNDLKRTNSAYIETVLEFKDREINRSDISFSKYEGHTKRRQYSGKYEEILEINMNINTKWS